MRIYYYFLCISMLSFLSSCDQQEALSGKTVEPAEIKVNLFLQEGDQSFPMNDVIRRQASTRAKDNTLTPGFNLYGFYTNTDTPTAIGGTSPEDVNSNKFIIDNKKVNNDGTLEGGPYHWIGNGSSRHSFFAYSGSTVSTNPAYINKPYSGLQKSDFHPYITYTQADDPAKQEDFLVAYGPSNLIVYQSVPAINLYFRHACARVIFKIMTLGSSTLYNLTAKMTYKSNSVYKKGDVHYKPQAKSTYNTYSTGTHTIATGVLVPSSASTEGKAILLNDLKLVPQQLSSAWIIIDLNYKLSETTSDIKTSRTAVPGLKIEPDNQYTFYLTVSDRTPNITVSNVVISPWITEKLLVDPLY